MSLVDAATTRTRVVETGLLWGLVLLVAALSLLPIGRLVFEGLAPGGALSTSSLGKVLASQTTWTATANSLVTAIAGTVLAVLLGGTVALLTTLTDIRARNAFTFCFVLPLMIAPQVTALAGPSRARTAAAEGASTTSESGLLAMRSVISRSTSPRMMSCSTTVNPACA